MKKQIWLGAAGLLVVELVIGGLAFYFNWFGLGITDNQTNDVLGSSVSVLVITEPQVSCIDSENQVSLSWSEIDSARSYNVERKDPGSRRWITIKSGLAKSTVTYTDTSLKTKTGDFNYRVKASIRWWSAVYSNTVTASVIKCTGTTPPTPTCTPNWFCTDWSICSTSGSQTRICNDSNNCGINTNKPSEDKSCVPPPVPVPDPTPTCTPNWFCTDWSICSTSGNQTRTCNDANNCGVNTNKPVISQTCTPPPTPTPTSQYPLHTGITATVFWVGEPQGGGSSEDNALSAWDDEWQKNYGGYDDYQNRNGYYPIGFTPKENPFYLDLPYNDFNNNGTPKSNRLTIVPWASEKSTWGNRESLMKNRWVKIMRNGSTCYGQIEDAGPYQYDDHAYVFGTNDSRPKSTLAKNAGMDVSPALRDCLKFTGLNNADNKVDWQFVVASDVPTGPWKDIITTSQVNWP